MASKRAYTKRKICAGSPITDSRCEPQPKLQDLIPLAVAIAAGCEPCAQGAVTRALKQGSSPRHIEETLRIIAYMQTLECLIQNVGEEVMARMSKPLSAASETLSQAAADSTGQTTASAAE